MNNKLYNKILNEVYLIQDFDSWDKSENAFKNDIKSRLIKDVFVYQMLTNTFPRLFVEKELCKVVSPVQSEQFGIYRKKIYDKNGKNIFVNDDGYIQTKDIEIEKNGECYIYIRDLEECTSLKNMFWNCVQLTKVPKWDTSECENMTEMFQWCSNLQHVPLLDTSGLKQIPFCMFGGCDHLDEETKNIWRPNEQGTPTRIRI